MSDNAELVEQITKEPSNVQKKEKDPKRVAAGKKLAEKNKQMREEHARLKASEAQRATDSLHNATEPETETGGNVSGNLLSQLTLTNVISLVGIGLTVYAIFFKKQEARQDHAAWQEPVHTTLQQPQPEPQVKPKTEEARRIVKPKPKFGM